MYSDHESIVILCLPHGVGFQGVVTRDPASRASGGAAGGCGTEGDGAERHPGLTHDTSWSIFAKPSNLSSCLKKKSLVKNSNHFPKSLPWPDQRGQQTPGFKRAKMPPKDAPEAPGAFAPRPSKRCPNIRAWE